MNDNESTLFSPVINTQPIPPVAHPALPLDPPPRRPSPTRELAKVFAYAFPDPSNVERVEGMPWGCVAHSIGVLDGIIKVFYGR